MRTDRRRGSTGGSTERAVRIEPSGGRRLRSHFRVPLRVQDRRWLLRAAVGFHFYQAGIGRRLKMGADSRPFATLLTLGSPDFREEPLFAPRQPRTAS